MLSDEERTKILSVHSSGSLYDLSIAIERAVLAKASQQVQGVFSYGEDNDGWYVENNGEQVCYCASETNARNIAYMMNSKTMPAPKQEPVHWRAVISDADKERNPIVSRHVVGFTQLSAAEEWVAAEHDFGGWNYTIEPLYRHPAPPQAAAIPEGLNELIEACRKICYPMVTKQSALDVESMQSALNTVQSSISAAPKPEGE